MNAELFSFKRFQYRKGQVFPEKEEYVKDRSPFQKDYDRIIFCNSFARLASKTQVHPLAKNDHVHNRLTHSLETASVGRSLGFKVGLELNKKGFLEKEGLQPHDVATLVQAACLAHDIGNPPFGHGGEEAIKEWFKNRIKEEESDNFNGVRYFENLNKQEKQDFCCFDGNAHSFRLVTQVEHNRHTCGMRLTFSTLAAMVKYPWGSLDINKNEKFGFFRNEEYIFSEVFNELGLVAGDKYKRYSLSYLTETADDICYSLIDIKDAIELNIINLKDIENIFLHFVPKNKLEEIVADKSKKKSDKISYLCAIAINNLTQHATYIYNKNLYRFLDENDSIKDLISIFEDENLIAGVKEAKTFSKEYVFKEKRKIELELGAYNIIEVLLDNFIKAAYESHYNKDNPLSFRSKRALDLMGNDKPSSGMSLYQKYLCIVDYIVGMTDNYATYTAHQLSGMAY